jgi:hypothetical protein
VTHVGRDRLSVDARRDHHGSGRMSRVVEGELLDPGGLPSRERPTPNPTRLNYLRGKTLHLSPPRRSRCSGATAPASAAYTRSIGTEADKRWVGGLGRVLARAALWRSRSARRSRGRSRPISRTSGVSLVGRATFQIVRGAADAMRFRDQRLQRPPAAGPPRARRPQRRAKTSRAAPPGPRASPSNMSRPGNPRTLHRPAQFVALRDPRAPRLASPGTGDTKAWARRLVS